MTDRELSFEQALTRLEEIVERMEGGDLSLDESLSLFQEGVGLSQVCSRQLNTAEERIHKLVRIEDGKFSIEHFETEPSSEDVDASES